MLSKQEQERLGQQREQRKRFPSTSNWHACRRHLCIASREIFLKLIAKNCIASSEIFLLMSPFDTLSKFP